MLRAAMVIDYQNVHMTAHDIFDPHGAIHRSLIHPMQFARTAIQQRNSVQRQEYPAADLTRVLVYRGLPHVDYQSDQNRRCQAQAEQRRSDGADVRLRDLTYRYQYGDDGRPILDIFGRKVPTKDKPSEKGVDVLCALACVREASRTDIDLVILASPAIPTYSLC